MAKIEIEDMFNESGMDMGPMKEKAENEGLTFEIFGGGYERMGEEFFDAKAYFWEKIFVKIIFLEGKFSSKIFFKSSLDSIEKFLSIM